MLYNCHAPQMPFYRAITKDRLIRTSYYCAGQMGYLPFIGYVIVINLGA